MSGMAVAARWDGQAQRVNPKKTNKRLRQLGAAALVLTAIAAATMYGLPAHEGAPTSQPSGNSELRVLGDRLLAAREALAAVDAKTPASGGRELLQSLEHQRVDLERQHAELKARRAPAGPHGVPDLGEAAETSEQLAGVRAALVKVYEAQARAQQQVREQDRLRAEVNSLARQYRDTEARLQQPAATPQPQTPGRAPSEAPQDRGDRILPPAWPALMALGAIIAVAAVGVVLGTLALLGALVRLLQRLIAWLRVLARRAVVASVHALGSALRRAVGALGNLKRVRLPARAAPAAAAPSSGPVRAAPPARPAAMPSAWIPVASHELAPRARSAAEAARTQSAATVELNLIDPMPLNTDPDAAAWEPITLKLRPVPFAEPASKARRVLIVTSADHEAAKADVACRLAASFVEQGHSVLLMEADLRQPQLMHALRLPAPAVGVADLLAGHGTLDEALTLHEDSGADVLLQAAAVMNPADLLFRPALAELMTSLRVRYDRVVVHVPPLMAAGDALAFAQIVDGATMVVPAREATADMANDATSRLELAGIPVTDVVPDAPTAALADAA